MAYRFALSVLALMLTITLLAIPAKAQLTRGSIAGTVTDNTGAAIAGAQVTITNLGTNIARVGTSNEAGLYRLPALEPGVYVVKIEKDGFDTIEI